MFSAVRPDDSKMICTDEVLGNAVHRADQVTAKGLVILNGADWAEPVVSNRKSVPGGFVAVILGNRTIGTTGAVTAVVPVPTLV
jgi:hypothetical protein